MEENKKLWFRRKLYGWGWTPSSWEGWLTILVYLGILYFFFIKIDMNSHSASGNIIGFVLLSFILTFILILICYKKGEKPKWQWGKRVE